MKKKIGSKNLYYPTLTILAGTVVNGKPNYEAIAWGGILGMKHIYIASNISHYSNSGIKENKTFSVNIPSASIVKETDFCGIYSGKENDKSEIFKNFYGELGTAPMIEECSINMECELIDTFVIEDHEIFIGRIKETYCDEEYMTNGKVDLKKVNPLLFSFHDASYWSIGEHIAKSWSVGRKEKS